MLSNATIMPFMVWYGMVWYGMVWYGMVWGCLNKFFLAFLYVK